MTNLELYLGDDRECVEKLRNDILPGHDVRTVQDSIEVEPGSGIDNDNVVQLSGPPGT